MPERDSRGNRIDNKRSRAQARLQYLGGAGTMSRIRIDKHPLRLGHGARGVSRRFHRQHLCRHGVLRHFTGVRPTGRHCLPHVLRGLYALHVWRHAHSADVHSAPPFPSRPPRQGTPRGAHILYLRPAEDIL